jgi:hypothetical protein
MDKKKLVAVVVAVALGVVTYLWGPNVVALVKDTVKSSEVAPVTTEAESQPTK